MVWKALGVWEGFGGFGRVWEGLGWFGMVWDGLGGLGGTRRHPSATPGFAQRWMSKFDTHHGALWRCDRLPPDTLQMSPKPIFGETGVQFAHLSLEGICCMRVPRRSRAFTSTQGRSQAPTSVRRHSQALRSFSSSRAFTARFQTIPNAPKRSQTLPHPNPPKTSQTLPNTPKPSQTLPPGQSASKACLSSLPPGLPLRLRPVCLAASQPASLPALQPAFRPGFVFAQALREPARRQRRVHSL